MIPDVTPNGVFYLPPTGWLTSFYNPPTHLATGLGVEACKNHLSTYFVNCHELIERLKLAYQENRLEPMLKNYLRYKLLIIDEIGYLPIDDLGSNLFFQLISRRYEKKSIIVTTNIPLSKWGQTFSNPTIANAILDRLIHHSEIFKFLANHIV